MGWGLTFQFKFQLQERHKINNFVESDIMASFSSVCKHRLIFWEEGRRLLLLYFHICNFNML